MKYLGLRKTLLVTFLIVAVNSLFAQTGKPLLPENPGMVSFTYRDSFSKDVPGTLDLIKSNGITDIEFSNLFKQTPASLRHLLDECGLKCSSYGVSFDDLVNHTDSIAQNAIILGASYVRVAGIPHNGHFTLDDAKKAVDAFNRCGKELKKKYRLTFIYHNHGFEFEPYSSGTLYDYLVSHTTPEYVSFELDILWAYFPGQDPARLLNTYGSRYKALHLKDLKKGVTGNLSGGTSQENDIVLGTGQIDIPAVIKAARKAGVKHFYIEDESSASVAQVPQSIAYLHNLTW